MGLGEEENLNVQTETIDQIVIIKTTNKPVPQTRVDAIILYQLSLKISL